MSARVDADVDTGVRPKASFVCISYNHVDFVGQCLDAFLAQEVDFDVEIVVHDDASEDGTRDVLASYAARCPGRFRLILPETNSGCPGHAMATALRHARGEYVLFCDADDHWTDVRKAQTQVDFLERHPQFAFTFHDAVRQNRSGTLTYPMMEDAWRRNWTSAEIAEAGSLFFCQSSLCFRNVLAPYPSELAHSPLGDVFLARMLGHAGAGAYLGDEVRPTTSALHEGGVWSGATDEQRGDMVTLTYLNLVAWLLRVGYDDEAQRLARRELVPRLLGTHDLPAPAPPFSWRHPGSLLLIARRRWALRYRS